MNSPESFRLISYLSAAQLFDDGKNIFDCFLVIIESILIKEFHEKKNIVFPALQRVINRDLALNIPSATLEYFLLKLKRDNKIEYEAPEKIKIIEDNKKSNGFQEALETNEARIESFFCTFADYLQECNINAEISDLKSQCCQWIYVHTIDLMQLVDQGIYDKAKHEHADMPYETELVDYLLQESGNNSEEFRTFLALYNGALQASLLNFVPEKIEVVCDSFKFSNIILDSNYILRILELQSPFESRVALETLKLLKERNVNFYILRQTIDEVLYSIRKFISESDSYTQGTSDFFKNMTFRMNGLWEAFRSGKPRLAFLELNNRETLRKKLRSLMNVVFVDEYNPPVFSSEIIKDLIDFKGKPLYQEKQARHDLTLIDFCRQKRGKEELSVETADWWILTNDVRLSYWNHNQHSDVQECLTERQLSNLLWIQHEKRDFSGLYETIAALSNNDSLSIEDVHALAKRLNQHLSAQRNSEDINKLAIVFANATITKSDVEFLESTKNFNEFTDHISKRKNQLQIEQGFLRREKLKIVEELDDAKERNIDSEATIRILQERIEQIKQEKKEHDNKEKRIQIKELESRLKLYEALKAYANDKAPIIVRSMYSIEILLALFFAWGFCSFIEPLRVFFDLDKMDIAWVATVVPFISRSVIVIFITIFAILTGKHINESAIFEDITNTILRFVVRLHLFHQGLPSMYLNDILSPDYENKITALKSELQKLKNSILALYIIVFFLVRLGTDIPDDLCEDFVSNNLFFGLTIFMIYR